MLASCNAKCDTQHVCSCRQRLTVLCGLQRETFRRREVVAAEPQERIVGSNGSNGSSPAGNGATPGVDDGADSLDEPSPPERPSLTVHHMTLLEK